VKKVFLIFLILNLYLILKAEENFEIKNVTTGLDTPWEISWGPDNYIWMTERYGRISRINPNNGELQVLLNIDDVFEDGERGLMGMVLHPDFINNPYVYTVYTYRGKSGETWIKMERYEYNGNSLSNPKTIIDSIKGAWNHDGSRLIIDKDLTLYMTTGDAAVPALAQDMNSLNGKILRMNLDGTIPADNPNPLSYVWSSGHRNPQGLIKINDIMYSSEHGASTDDELNIILKARNYGWPNVEGYCDKANEKTFCEQNNIVEPIAAWTPTLAVAGIDYYNNDKIPSWKNSILMVVLKSARLVQMKLSDDGKKVVEENHFFTNEFGRLRDICVSPDGRVFISTSNKDGRGNPGVNDDRIIEIIPISSDIEENEIDEFSISPNPTSDYITIRKNNNLIAKIEIINIFGNTVFTSDFISDEMTINLNDLISNDLVTGFYFVRYTNGQKVINEKIIIE
jgi:glucose/arabinose dehydrogenase